MKTIGLIGGLSWESSLEYYRKLNQLIAHHKGGLHSAKILMHSVDFAEVETYMSTNRWQQVSDIVSEAAKRLESGGADFFMIGSNTIHKVAPLVKQHVSLPFLSIIDETAQALVKDHRKKTIFLGTRYTMTDSFFVDGLQEKGIEVILPDDEEKRKLNAIIFDELCLGIFTDLSKSFMIDMINSLAEQGADSVCLACTELGLIVKSTDLSLPIYDTLDIHAKAAVDQSLSC